MESNPNISCKVGIVFFNHLTAALYIVANSHGFAIRNGES